VEVIVRSTPTEAVAVAVRLVADLVRRRPTATLGLATGQTMVPFYEQLLRHQRETALSFARVAVFALDEYRGAPPDHPGSCRGFLEAQLLRHIDVDRARVTLLDGQARHPAAECQRYELAIREAGGLDLQLLGIGGNGHIGFNEPGSPLDSRTRIVALSGQTREANAPQWGGRAADVPDEALTMGIATILEARACLLLAFGAVKACAVASAVEGPMTPKLPASALQRHPNTTFVLDLEAASYLTEDED
jgi:glucosamine-6-phosphate deaminase